MGFGYGYGLEAGMGVGSSYDCGSTGYQGRLEAWRRERAALRDADSSVEAIVEYRLVEGVGEGGDLVIAAGIVLGSCRRMPLPFFCGGLAGLTAPSPGVVLGASGSSSQCVSANTLAPSTGPKRAMNSPKTASFDVSSAPNSPKKNSRFDSFQRHPLCINVKLVAFLT